MIVTMAKGFVRVPVEIIGDRVRPRSLFFNSHCVLRQQNSGCRLVARWFGSSGAPGQDHLFEGYENRAVGFTGTKNDREHVLNFVDFFIFLRINHLRCV